MLESCAIFDVENQSLRLWLCRLPPLPAGCSFQGEYEILLVLDQREQFCRAAGQNRNESLAGHVGALRAQGMSVEIRTLEQGDAVWIARSR